MILHWADGNGGRKQIQLSEDLPTASETTKGGVKIGDGLYMDGETLKRIRPADFLSVAYRSAVDFTSKTISFNLNAAQNEIAVVKLAVRTADGYKTKGTTTISDRAACFAIKAGKARA